MTDATNGDNRPDEEKRLVIEDAILAFRPEVVRDFPRDPRPAPGPALTALAATASIQRLTKHRRLVDGFRRIPPDLRADLDDQARSVLDSTLDQSLPDDRRQILVERAKRRLDEIAATPGEARLQRQHWRLWVQSTDAIFQFSRHEQTFEACNDQQLVMKFTPDGELVLSRLLIAQFWSDLPPASFRPFLEPQNWPVCCPFWRSVVSLQPQVKAADGYDWDFDETVNIITETLTVPLHIGFRVRPDQSRLSTRFDLSRTFYLPTTEVDVDSGIISAELVPGGPAQTLVQAVKYLHWRDPSRPDPTALACDFGWCELLEEMAYGCGQGFGTPGETAPSGAKTSVDAAIGQLVGAVTAQCRQGLSENAPNVEQLIGRFTGSSWDAGWVNDLLNMSLVTARHYGNIAGDVRRFADSLRDAATERDGHG
jgi:hypothetical protein